MSDDDISSKIDRDEKSKWYNDASRLIALAALIVSSLSLYFSYSNASPIMSIEANKTISLFSCDGFPVDSSNRGYTGVIIPIRVTNLGGRGATLTDIRVAYSAEKMDGDVRDRHLSFGYAVLEIPHGSDISLYGGKDFWDRRVSERIVTSDLTDFNIQFSTGLSDVDLPIAAGDSHLFAIALMLPRRALYDKTIADIDVRMTGGASYRARVIDRLYRPERSGGC